MMFTEWISNSKGDNINLEHYKNAHFDFGLDSLKGKRPNLHSDETC